VRRRAKGNSEPQSPRPESPLAFQSTLTMPQRTGTARPDILVLEIASATKTFFIDSDSLLHQEGGQDEIETDFYPAGVGVSFAHTGICCTGRGEPKFSRLMKIEELEVRMRRSKMSTGGPQKRWTGQRSRWLRAIRDYHTWREADCGADLPGSGEGVQTTGKRHGGAGSPDCELSLRGKKARRYTFDLKERTGHEVPDITAKL